MLLVKGAWSDIHGLVRRLGPVCGRPKKELSDPNFNYSIALHKLDESALAGVEAALRALAPAGLAGKTPIPSAPSKPKGPKTLAPPDLPVPPHPPKREGPKTIALPNLSNTPAPQMPPEPFAGFGGVPPPGSQASAQPSSPAPATGTPFAGFGLQDDAFRRKTANEPLSPPFETLPDLMAAANTPDPVPLGDAIIAAYGGLSLTPSAPPQAAPASPAPASAAVPEPKAAIEPSVVPAAPPEPPKPRPKGTTSLPLPVPKSLASPASAGEPLFGAIKGIDSERTFDNLVVGSYNRFAHAAAMSVLTSSGSLYNPLIIWGGTGSGKTHIANSMALRLQEQAPHETIWLSSGSAISRAAGLAQAAGRVGELCEFAAKARALVIDDLHMTGIADHNREALAKVLGVILGAGRQVVVTSLYQPRHIVSIEQALGLRTDKTHAVELKVPNDAAQQSIGEAALARLGLAPSSAEKDVFARGLLKDFTVLDDHLSRLSALAVLSASDVPLAQFLREIFAADAEAVAMTAAQLKAILPAAPAFGKTPLALCHPPGGEVHADFLLARVGEAAKARGWSFPWGVVGRLAYPVDPPHAAPYLLAEECLRSGAVAALVVGPPPGTDLAGQERPFRATAQRLLSEAGLSCAVVPFSRVQDPKQALFAYLDIAPRPGGRV